jgi:proteic killer suppression protein
MIVSFRNTGTEDIFRGRSTKAARHVCPEVLWKVARRKLAYVNAAVQLSDLRMPPSNKLHPLLQDRAGQHAIWINSQYRVCFRWTEAGAEDVEITDYH